MVKKVEKQKNIQKNIGFPIKLNSIMTTIVVFMFSIVFVVEGIMYAFTKDVIKNMHSTLMTDFFSSLSLFNVPNQTVDQFKNDIYILRDRINNTVSKEYEVRDIILTDSKMKTLAKTLPQEARYVYRNSSDPNTFQLTFSPKYNVDHYRAIHLKRTLKSNVKGNISKATYYVHIIIPKETSFYINKMTQFAIVFLLIVLVMSIMMSIFLAKSISNPLSNMEQIVSRIAKGDLSGRVDYTKYDEMNKLAQSYNMMADALQRLYSTLENKVQDRTKELNKAYKELQSTQAIMVHSEKMKSLGELVAGIMHEINNPINFIYGNMIHLNNYSLDLINIIEEYSKYDDSLKPDEKKDIQKMKEEVDFEFLKSDMPDLIKSCREGADRAKNIIQDLKSFSRMEEVAIANVDIPHEIDTTLNILHNKLKNKATIHKEYMDNVPKIEAFGGQLNQVFMNLLDNAAGAIPEHGDIWIRINTDEQFKNLLIQFEDNGSGMDEETMRKVFNPFFTTKPVGQGTGLGLSITYKIIKNHQGNITVESKPDVGTKFTITLPIKLDKEILKAANGENNEQV